MPIYGRYEGEFKNGKKHGKGKFIGEDGSEYEGEFVNDERKGNGLLIYPDNKIYKGEFRKNKPNGNGKLERLSGSILEGKWVNGNYMKESDRYNALLMSTQYSDLN